MSESEKNGHSWIRIRLGMQCMCNHKPGFGIISQTLKLKRFGALASIVSVKKLFTEAAMSIGRKDAKRLEHQFYSAKTFFLN